MSGQAIITPDEVKRFASALKRFNEELRGNSNRVHGQLRQLGESWRDQEHAKFEQEFSQAMQAIKRFADSSDQYVAYLTRKAQAAQDYLNTH